MKLKNEYNNGTEVIEMTEQQSEILKAIAEGREIKTRDGHEVRIYATDGNDPFPIHGAVKLQNGWSLHYWRLQGQVAWGVQRDPRDLIPAPRTIEIAFWANVYEDGSYFRYATKEEADTAAASSRFACINIKRTVKEGEGL